MKLREAEMLAGAISQVYARRVTGPEVRSWSARQRRLVAKYAKEHRRLSIGTGDYVRVRMASGGRRKRPRLPQAVRS
jgi:hypothetical protein